MTKNVVFIYTKNKKGVGKVIQGKTEYITDDAKRMK